jgi:hypothetical protein
MSEDERSFCLAQPDRVLGQRLENGLEIKRGSTDNLKEFAGSGLLLPRLGQFVRKPQIVFFLHRLPPVLVCALSKP